LAIKLFEFRDERKMENKTKLKLIGALFLATGLWLSVEMAYDFYVFFYLEINQGVWLSPFGILSPWWFIPIGLTGLVLAIWQFKFYGTWWKLDEQAEQMAHEDMELKQKEILESIGPTITKCPQCGGKLSDA